MSAVDQVKRILRCFIYQTCAALKETPVRQRLWLSTRKLIEIRQSLMRDGENPLLPPWAERLALPLL
jgi:hypothetical protein